MAKSHNAYRPAERRTSGVEGCRPVAARAVRDVHRSQREGRISGIHLVPDVTIGLFAAVVACEYSSV